MKFVRRLVIMLVAAVLITSLVACEKPREQGEEFSVLTWNVYLGNGESECVLNVLDEYLPDIVQMQEASPTAYKKFVQPFLKKHPEYFIIDEPFNGETLRTPIIFNADKFGLVASGAELLTDSYTLTPTKTIGWALLESVNGNRLLALNFHGVKCLEKYEDYKDYTEAERDAIEEQWHIGNAGQLLARIAAVQEEYGASKVLITGDCNFNNTSGAYKRIVEAGYLDAEISAEINTQDGMRTSHFMGVEASGQGLTIDHVYSDTYLKYHKIIRTHDTYFGSDHCPVYVKAEL